MFEESIPNKSFSQICLIADDLERYRENYRRILGFEIPQEIHLTYDHHHTLAHYHGQPLDARARIAIFMVGRVAFEILQPIEAGSVWMDHLKAHGTSIHHVAFDVPRSAPAAAHFTDKGYPVTQQGLFTGRTGMYTYLDTQAKLGITMELLEPYRDGGPFEPKPFPADKGIGTDVVVQVGLVVNDIETTIQRYRDLLGLLAPIQLETPGYAVTESTFLGQPTEATAKLAFFDFGQIQLELIQPDANPSVWRNYLNERGDSAHHVAFRVQDTQKAVDHFAQHSIGVIQQGYFGDRGGMYTYLDSEKELGLIVELLESFPAPR